MQNKVQLYIENQRVDLFNDETIEVTSTIQDFRDIGKIFSDFTQSFNVPASNTNNKIFKHFYNFNITGGAYDNRKKKEAFIEINYLPFRQGKVRLNSIKMRNNKPHSYDITFLGKTVVSIQDTIGDDLISQLPYLDNYDHEYTDTNVKNGFQNGLDFTVNSVSQTDAIIYPLITSKKRLFYSSFTGTVPVDADFDGNLFYESSSNNNRGLEYTDLKPAIKAIHIIEAIEAKYDNIEFTRDFFGSNTAFSNLYLWLNPKKEEFNYIEDNSTDQPYIFNKKLSGYTSTDPHSGVNISDSQITLTSLVDIYNLDLTFDVSSQSTAYRIIVRDVSTGVENITDGVGDKTELNIYNTYLNNTGIRKAIEIEFSSETGVTFSNISLDVKSSPFTIQDKTYTITSNASQETKFNIDITKKIPEMKVLDFLTGLFKVFNLTAYYVEDVNSSDYQKIYVDTLDNFYADAVNNKLTQTITLDKYVDISQHQIDSILPFTDIEFKYTETNTVINEHHKEFAKKYYGNAEYNVRENIKDGTTLDYNVDRVSKYEINLPFSHLKYERILDVKTGARSETDIQWGYSAGGEFSADTSLNPSEGNYESMLIKPLLFYAVRETSISTPIAWYDGGTVTSLSNYYRPSNTNETGTTTTPASFTLNFETEIDEWTRAINPNSLYDNFYKSYVEGIFNPLRRIFKVTAYLPASILVNYKLNHQIRLGDKMFRINSVSVDLVTGKAEFELYNIFEDDIV